MFNIIAALISKYLLIHAHNANTRMYTPSSPHKHTHTYDRSQHNIHCFLMEEFVLIIEN